MCRSDLPPQSYSRWSGYGFGPLTSDRTLLVEVPTGSILGCGHGPYIGRHHRTRGVESVADPIVAGGEPPDVACPDGRHRSRTASEAGDTQPGSALPDPPQATHDAAMPARHRLRTGARRRVRRRVLLARLPDPRLVAEGERRVAAGQDPEDPRPGRGHDW